MVWQPAEGGTAVSATEWSEGRRPPTAPDLTTAAGPASRRRPTARLTPASPETDGAGGTGPDRDRRPRGGWRRTRRGGRRRGPRQGLRGKRGGSGIAPIRTCIGCRTTGPAEHLIRVVLVDGGRWRSSRTSPGRGAWLCRESPMSIRRSGGIAFSRALRSEVGSDQVAGLRVAMGSGAGHPTREQDWARESRSRDVRG